LLCVEFVSKLLVSSMGNRLFKLSISLQTLDGDILVFIVSFDTPVTLPFSITHVPVNGSVSRWLACVLAVAWVQGLYSVITVITFV